jgi:hypothetical protein
MEMVVIVVEHDEDIMKAADMIIDIIQKWYLLREFSRARYL